jgi:hypothetical protein
VPASFGIVPRRHIPPGVKVFDTMNARSESVAEERSFSGAWKNLQLCLFPLSLVLRAELRNWEGRALEDRYGERRALGDRGPVAPAEGA